MLTKREVSILQLLADGHTRPKIAAELGIGRRTVDWWIEQARNKLDAHTTGQLVAHALRLDLIK